MPKPFSSMTLEELLDPSGHPCSCGRVHKSGLEYLKIGEDALDALPEALEKLGCSRPFVVCDLRTKAAAWEKVKAVLDQNQTPYTFYCLNQEQPEPDEHAMGSLVMAFDPNCDLVLGIGSGVINDSCKVLARAVGRPCAICGTAPSMDGYASNSSSMIISGMKVSLYNACPEAVIADSAIMRKAPERMLWAGLGDMLAKYVSVCEWRISHLVTGEYYCENIAGLVRRSVADVVNAAPGLMKREPEAIQAVAQGLVLSGVAMGFAENSRPASGVEHYFSHIWDMMALRRGQPYDLHGIHVGVATLLTLGLYDKLRAYTPDEQTALAKAASFDPDRWEQSVRNTFGDTAESVLKLVQTVQKNDPANHRQRLQNILIHWDEIQQIIREELPETARIEQLVRDAGMPLEPGDIGIPRQDVYDAYIGSRDMRDKYVTTSLLWDLGVLYAWMDREEKK